jgi:hypothetical protein
MSNKLTLVDLLCSLRERLIDAREQNSKKDLEELLITFGVLIEESYKSEDNQVIEILVALEDSTRDAIGGISGKSHIPSEEEIRTAFSSPSQ